MLKNCLSCLQPFAPRFEQQVCCEECGASTHASPVLATSPTLVTALDDIRNQRLALMPDISTDEMLASLQANAVQAQLDECDTMIADAAHVNLSDAFQNLLIDVDEDPESEGDFGQVLELPTADEDELTVATAS